MFPFKPPPQTVPALEVGKGNKPFGENPILRVNPEIEETGRLGGVLPRDRPSKTRHSLCDKGLYQSWAGLSASDEKHKMAPSQDHQNTTLVVQRGKVAVYVGDSCGAKGENYGIQEGEFLWRKGGIAV